MGFSCAAGEIGGGPSPSASWAAAADVEPTIGDQNKPRDNHLGLRRR